MGEGFTVDENERLDAWFNAGKPGDPWDSLGITKDEYESKRDDARKRTEAFLDQPVIRAWIARRTAEWLAEQS